MNTKLTDEQRAAVEAQQGCITLEGETGEYVLMRMEYFRELLGLDSSQEYEASLQAIREGWADVCSRRTRPMDEFFAEFDRRHGIPD